MAKSYPVQFKGTAIGDPAIAYNPLKRTNNLDRNISNADQAKELSALSKSAENKLQTKKAEYKGTPIGDPARSLTQAGYSNTISAAIDPTKINTLLKPTGDQMMSKTVTYKGTAIGDPANRLTARSHPVDYVGAAFGDPALAPRLPQDPTQMAAAKGYPIEYKGTAFGDPAKFGGGELQRVEDRNITKNNVATGNLALANQSPGRILNLLV